MGYGCCSGTGFQKARSEYNLARDLYLKIEQYQDSLPSDTIKQNKVQNSSIHDFKLSNTGNITYTDTWSCQVCGKPFPSYQAYTEHFSNET